MSGCAQRMIHRKEAAFYGELNGGCLCRAINYGCDVHRIVGLNEIRELEQRFR